MRDHRLVIRPVPAVQLDGAAPSEKCIAIHGHRRTALHLAPFEVGVVRAEDEVVGERLVEGLFVQLVGLGPNGEVVGG